ncbi:uncharacterized protein TNCV_3501571 [Trichonephila clavipes]|uniref:Uncharacterized protein n=1 Tax=Trichonephila clavipes TaxID=2585209 RepID=A0A8X6VCC2_TRICX|nr:uncharacterized protein TNCV_3501571 [Trichonephila clavipes]
MRHVLLEWKRCPGIPRGKPKGRPTKRRKMLAENSKKRWQKSSETVDEKNSNSMVLQRDTLSEPSTSSQPEARYIFTHKAVFSELLQKVPCKYCTNCTLVIKQHHSMGYSTKMELLCESCHESYESVSSSFQEEAKNSHDINSKLPKVKPQGHTVPCENLLVATSSGENYARLASDTILERGVAGKTKNSNESLHSCIWRKCPKDVFVSKRRLEIAVTEAIEKHNLGYVKFLELKEDSCLNDIFSLTIAERQDKRRISQSISTKQKKRKRNATNTDSAYSAGAF